VLKIVWAAKNNSAARIKSDVDFFSLVNRIAVRNNAIEMPVIKK
jgi:hypothetical protein